MASTNLSRGSLVCFGGWTFSEVSPCSRAGILVKAIKILKQFNVLGPGKKFPGLFYERNPRQLVKVARNYQHLIWA